MLWVPSEIGKLISAKSLLLLAGLWLSGCSTLHDAFLDRALPLATPDNASLGHSTRDDLVHQFGDPDEIDAHRLDASPSEVLFYVDPYEDDAHQPRHKVLTLEFTRGVLNAYAFQDTGTPPPQGFTELDRAKLAKGKSTRRDIVNALGTPQSKALLPTAINLPALDLGLGGAPFALAKLPDSTREIWQYHTQNLDDSARRISQQTLTVFIDGQGVYLGDAVQQTLITKAP